MQRRADRAASRMGPAVGEPTEALLAQQRGLTMPKNPREHLRVFFWGGGGAGYCFLFNLGLIVFMGSNGPLRGGGCRVEEAKLVGSQEEADDL